MTIGWMKLHRSLLEKPVFEDAYTLQVLIYCLLKATYKDMTVRVGNQAIELKPGQLLYGRKSVSQKLGMGESRLRGIMAYLEQNGTIAIERFPRYSIVTVRNWEQYQNGEGVPDFPFDCDFLDEEEPPCSHFEMQDTTGFADLEPENSAGSEPQYNNINKYKNNNKIKENKTKEKNPDTQTSANTADIADTQNIQNPETLNRQIHYAAHDCAAAQGERVLRPQYEYSSGGGITKGESMSCEAAEQADADSSSEALAALSMLDDAALDAYFADCAYAMFDIGTDKAHDADCGFIPLDDTDMPPVQEPGCRPGHEFAAEMTYSLTEQDIARLEAMFSSSPAAIDEIDPYEQDWIAAHQLFEILWKMYPVKAGKEKVSDAQIMRLYEIGAKPMKQAIWNYQNKKHRVPKKYLMNGSTFFNGGYEKYLPESAIAQPCAEKCIL